MGIERPIPIILKTDKILFKLHSINANKQQSIRVYENCHLCL